MKQTIVLATGNQHKVKELQHLFAIGGMPDVTFVAVTDIVTDFAPIEDGDTFEANAWIKAKHAFDVTGLACLADDSGLEIEALGGEPGVHSARYSGENANDASNRRHAQSRLQQLGLEQSPAAFRCVLCLVTPGAIVFGEGSCNGTISTHEAGSSGFGYDPMFTPEGSLQTFGEMSESEKSSRSHRAKAVQHLLSKVLDVQPYVVQNGYADTDMAVVTACMISALGRWDDLTVHLQNHVNSEESIRKYYEALLQTYLFAGYPVALEALLQLHSVVRNRFPEYHHTAEPFNEEEFRKRGQTLFDTIYQDIGSKVIATVGAATPDLADWMILEGYGKTLSRDGLSVIERELCIVGVLAALSHGPQLTSHVRGAILCGARADQLDAVAQVVKNLCTDNAFNMLTGIIDRYRKPLTTS